jgi:hypothetical protein
MEKAEIFSFPMVWVWGLWTECSAFQWYCLVVADRVFLTKYVSA